MQINSNLPQPAAEDVDQLPLGIRITNFYNKLYAGDAKLLGFHATDMSANWYFEDGAWIDAYDLQESLEECGATFEDVEEVAGHLHDCWTTEAYTAHEEAAR